jgi:hypothetical protein
MHRMKIGVPTLVCGLAMSVSSPNVQSQPGGSKDSKTVVQSRLPIFGHRSWIVVVDSAFPAYAEPGIETIVVVDHPQSLPNYLASAISSTGIYEQPHFWTRNDSSSMSSTISGGSELRRHIAMTLEKDKLCELPHSEVMTKINEARKTPRLFHQDQPSDP